jgi:hypothetical protein
MKMDVHTDYSIDHLMFFPLVQGMWWGERKIMWLVMNINMEGWRGSGRHKKDGLTMWGRRERWLWVIKWRVIEENGGRRHAAPTPSELRKGHEEEEEEARHKVKDLISLELCRQSRLHLKSLAPTNWHWTRVVVYSRVLLIWRPVPQRRHNRLLMMILRIDTYNYKNVEGTG